ncbi:UNVERIFIED_CONTAM: hypothetical protein PYX00_003791 [Menopon gallinae]|uniref:Major facilitator superfamily (MFS) profile domain-containing protein n=1 Tax=Menopon gallinae TaxID=328185 RepID=A0AAW2I382_9NEOP
MAETGTKAESTRDVEKTEEDEEDATDPIKQSIGDFGKWQLFTCIALATCKIPVAWHQLGIVFLAPNINFTCIETVGNLGEVYKPIFSTLAIEDDPRCFKDGKECIKWEYDNSTFSSTIISEWDLVCKKKELADVAQTIYMLGVLAGSVLFGMAADKWGRKLPLMATVVLQIVSGIATAYIEDYVLFLVLRFLDAAATGGEMVVSFVICMELLSKKWRALVSVLYHVPFFIGHCLLPVISYFIRDWRSYQLAISIPPVILLGYWWVVPESPRWLLAKNKKDDALKILRTAAKVNKLPQPEMEILELEGKKDEPVANGTIIDLFRTPNLRKRSICILFNWITSGFCFFGLAQYMSKLGGNIFWNVAISGMMEVPGSIFCIYFMEKHGRRITLRVANVVGGAACLCILAVPEDADPIITVVLAALGVVGMSVSFPTIYLYTGELFPTVVRNVGVGTASMCARIGSTIAPFIASLVRHRRGRFRFKHSKYSNG